MNPDQMIRDYYGSNYDKAMKSALKAKMDSREKFLKKYPYADMSKFRIFVNQKKSGVIESTDIDYVIDDDTLVGVDTDTFRSNALWMSALTWPSPWGVGGKVQNFSIGTWTDPPNIVEVFIANDLSFQTDLKAFDITSSDSKDYKDNSYLASLYAAYTATYLCGMSTKHFEYKRSVPNIVTSIARYHLYYHMMRFLRDPSKMSRYISGDIKKMVDDHKPTKGIWEDGKFHQGQENLGTWLSNQPRGTVRNAKQVFSSHGGQVGIRYDKLVGKTIVGLDDYRTFIASESNGLTKVGELLFQQSIESYVYCVLGAQAKTRWPIVGYGARSLQTQEVFRKLVGDTVLQDDHTVTLSNMRGAIKSTNVVLNMAVSPGIILVPSNMIILDKMISGYNNVLTIAKSGMKFGRNDGANYFKHDTIRPIAPDETSIETNSADVEKTPIPGVLQPISTPSVNMEDLYVFLASAVIGSAAAAWLI